MGLDQRKEEKGMQLNFSSCLEKAKVLGIRKALVVCDQSNIGSEKNDHK